MRRYLITISAALFISQGFSQVTTFQKTMGSAFSDRGTAMVPTTDGGYIMTGYSESFGTGNWDLLVTKTNANGNVRWSKIYGNVNQDDQGYDIKQTTDGGYIITGRTDFGSGNRDVYLLKTAANGNLTWSKTFGGGSFEEGYSVEQTSDGGYIVTGRTRMGAGGWDVYLIKTDANGNQQWSRTYGTGNDEWGQEVHQTSDGGYIVTGTTEISGGGRNIYLVKTNNTGTVQWTSIFRTGNDEYGYSVQQTTDGGYIVTGRTDDFGPGNWDILLLKVGSTGSLQWSTSFGGTNYDAGYSVKQTTDGGYAIGGESSSFGSGGSDAILLKTDSKGNLQWSKTYGGNNDEEGWRVYQTSDGGYAVGGMTRSFGSGDWDMYLVKVDASGNGTCSQTTPGVGVVAYSPSTNSGGNTGSSGSTTTPSTKVQSVSSYTTCVCNVTAAFASTAPECTGVPVDFTNKGTTGMYYSWVFDSGSSPGTSTQENPTGIVYSTPGIKTVTFIVTDSVCVDTISQNIMIHETPVVSMTSNAPQCVDAPVDFTNTGTSGTKWSYSWDFGKDGQPGKSGSENPTGIRFASGGTKTITFTISDQFCTNTDTATINIYSLPVAVAGPDTTICPDDTVQIGGASQAGYTYSWFPSNPLVISNSLLSNPLATPVASITNYIVTVVDTVTKCVNSDTVTVSMLPPVVANAGSDVVICRYDSVQIGSGFVSGHFYSWTPNTAITDSAIASPVVSPDSTSTYTLTVWNDYSCPPATDEVTVLVHQLPLANAGPDDTITVGSSAQLEATGGVQYEWTPSTGLNNSGIYNPVANPDSSTTYMVTVTDIYGCVQSDTMNLIVLTPNFWYPSAFSPDGDGVNDMFYIRGEGITDFEFKVFDQWGHILFYSTDLEVGWNGQQQMTGEDMPEGAYVFVVTGVLTNGDAVNENGLVNLIR